MKLAKSESIKSVEKELIASIISELDWENIAEKLKEKHDFFLERNSKFKNGDMVVHQDKIAYKLDFDLQMNFSVIFDRLGECIEISSGKLEDKQDDENYGSSFNFNNDENSRLARDLSGMIDDINKE